QKPLPERLSRGWLVAIRPNALKPALERLYREFDRSGLVQDPIERVRVFDDPADREIAGFVAAALAFGRVASVLASIDDVLAEIGPSPVAFVRGFDPGRDADRLLAFVHRWTRGRDIVALVLILQQMLRQSGSLEAFFLAGDDPAAPDISPGLESFCTRARAMDVRRAYGRLPARPAVHGFFARPSSGSACKRLNLFLRWMVRSDEIDLGVWTRLSPARLIIPLDVHVIRVGQCLGLTRYQSPGWRMAASITASLRDVDPTDPVRYDFALCHLGMLGYCGFRQAAGDSRCPMRGVCRPHVRRRRASPPPSGPR
ncbi:MAG: TIGR02757 family protein, partial [Acidobacteria bacterium]|nr:TIGR02757 family protein [Acidobacteriota bacterium]